MAAGFVQSCCFGVSDIAVCLSRFVGYVIVLLCSPESLPAAFRPTAADESTCNAIHGAAQNEVRHESQQCHSEYQLQRIHPPVNYDLADYVQRCADDNR